MYHNSTDRKRKPKAKSYTIKLFNNQGYESLYIEYEGKWGLLRWEGGRYFHRPKKIMDRLTKAECSKLDISGICKGHPMSMEEFLITFNNGAMPTIETLKGK